MNTILTDEDRRQIRRRSALADSPTDALIDQTEAAVLAKLREQQPAAEVLGTAEHPSARRLHWTTAIEDLPVGAKLYAAPAAPATATVQVPQDEGADGPLLDGDDWVITMANGHSGPGWYAHCADYPDEGAVFVAAAPEAPAPHPDDAAVDAFAQAMKDKLAAARAKGRGGWQTCPPEALSRMLRDHVEKGDPRDVANFCMFLWSLGHGIAAPQPASAQVPQADWAADARAWGNALNAAGLEFDAAYRRHMGEPTSAKLFNTCKTIIRDVILRYAEKVAAPEAPATATVQVPQGWVLAPDWKGYALLGTGNYVIEHSADFDPELGAELIIRLATDEDREGGRQVGEARATKTPAPRSTPRTWLSASAS